MNLAEKLQHLEPKIFPSQWTGYEHYKGYGVMMLPFSSGHLLGLRVFPENDFAPYKSVWHSKPEGDWRIYNDGPSLETTCPRLWGPALQHTELSKIELNWSGPNELTVSMEKPKLSWSMTMSAPPLMRLLNAVNTVQPLWTWKSNLFLRIREWIANKFFGMGTLRFWFVAPGGQDTVLMPVQSFFIKSSEATLEGQDLGHPIRLNKNPTIGGVPLPTRAVFMIGQAHAKIIDPEEYWHTRNRFNPKNLTEISVSS